MVKPAFNFASLDNSKKMRDQFETVLSKAEKILRLVTLSYFVLGLLIAPFYGTWLIGCLLGGANLVLFLFLQNNSSDILRTYYGFGLALFGVQFILQLNGDLATHIFLFNTLLLLVLLQNKRYLISFFVVVILFYLIIGGVLYLNSTLTSQFFSVSFNGYLIPIPIIQASLFTYLASKYIKKNIQKNLIQAIFIEEKLNVNANTELALQIAKGNLKTTYKLREDDILGEALVKMRDNLKELRERELVQKWNNTGIASISELLLAESKLDRLTAKVLRELIKLLRAQQGSIYLLETEGGEEQITLSACYASNKRLKLGKVNINIGEGLIGEVFQRKTPLEITSIPETYEFIHSGLGDSKPNSINLVPLNVKDTIIGVIEIASFQILKPHETQFLINVSENIAVAMASVINTQKTQKLLDEAQKFNEQISAQESIVQQITEELNFYKEQSQHSSFLIKAVSEIEAKSAFFYHKSIENGKLIYLSQSFEDFTGYNVQGFSDLEGKTLESIIASEYPVENDINSEDKTDAIYHIKLKDGDLLKVKDSSIKINNEEIIGVVRKY